MSITSNYQSAEDVLGFAGTATIKGTWNTAAGTLTLSGTDTLANYLAALRSVTYTDSSGIPNTSTRTVSFQVNDGSSASNVATRQITVAPRPSRRRSRWAASPP